MGFANDATEVYAALKQERQRASTLSSFWGVPGVNQGKEPADRSADLRERLRRLREGEHVLETLLKTRIALGLGVEMKGKRPPEFSTDWESYVRAGKRGGSVARLRAGEVREIRRLAGEVSQAELAERYGISQDSVGRIQRGKARADVREEA